MSGATITWDVSTPSGTSLVGQGPSVFTTMKSSLQSGLDAEHLWPAAGGYAGVHRDGSARAFWGAASAVSSSDTDGRLMVTSDTSRLYSVGASQTSFLLGGQHVVLSNPIFNNVGSNLTSQATQFWATETGRGSAVTGSATTAITLKHTYLTGAHANVQHDTTISAPSTISHFFHAQVNGATLTVTKYLLGTGAQTVFIDGQFSYQVTGRVSL